MGIIMVWIAGIGAHFWNPANPAAAGRRDLHFFTLEHR
jgi:hypothetical protein